MVFGCGVRVLMFLQGEDRGEHSADFRSLRFGRADCGSWDHQFRRGHCGLGGDYEQLAWTVRAVEEDGLK